MAPKIGQYDVDEIVHKNSSVLNKEPLPSQLDFGEISVNYNSSNPFLAIKLANNTIRKIFGDNSSGALKWKGEIAPTAVAPSSPLVGDTYALSVQGTFAASWGSPLASTTGYAGSFVARGDTRWYVIDSAALALAVNAQNTANSVSGTAAAANATANTASTTAAAAQTAANSAQTAATAAQTTATNAQNTANSANTAAAAAQTTANAANTAAAAAQTTANNALSTANSANTTATGIASTANTALTNANAAVTTANTASATATAAEATANSVSATASSALTTANDALTTANAANATANTAQTQVYTAQSSANAAQSTANTALSTANTAQSTATAAQTTANSASTAATNAQSTATSAQTAANNALTTANNANTAASARVLKTGDTMTGNLTIPSLNGGPLGNLRNLVINGDVSVWQRGSGVSNIQNGEYGPDNWKYVNTNNSGTGKSVIRNAFLRNQTTVAGSPKYYMSYNVGNANGTNHGFVIPIPQHDLFVNTQLTYSVWMKASTSLNVGTSWYAYFGTDSFSNPYSPSESKTSITSHNVSTTWTRFTGTFTPPTSGPTGSFRDNLDDWCGVFLDLPKSSTYTIDIAQFQLEYGGVATTFASRPFEQELALAQRFYNKSSRYSDPEPPTVSFGRVEFRTIVAATIPEYTFFYPPMRVTPTIRLYAAATYTAGNVRNLTLNTDVAVIAANQSPNSAIIRVQGTGTISAGTLFGFHYVLDACF